MSSEVRYFLLYIRAPYRQQGVDGGMVDGRWKEAGGRRNDWSANAAGEVKSEES
jgi:hypothetical protein